MSEEHPNGSHRTIAIPDPVVVSELALALEMKPYAVIAELMKLNMFVTMNTPIDFFTAASFCRSHGVVAQKII